MILAGYSPWGGIELDTNEGNLARMRVNASNLTSSMVRKALLEYPLHR